MPLDAVYVTAYLYYGHVHSTPTIRKGTDLVTSRTSEFS